MLRWCTHIDVSVISCWSNRPILIIMSSFSWGGKSDNEKRSPDVFVFMTEATLDNNGYVRLGHVRKIGGVCSTEKINRTAVCGYYKNDMKSKFLGFIFFHM